MISVYKYTFVGFFIEQFDCRGKHTYSHFIIYSNIPTGKHYSMKAQKHHPRICIREKKGRDKGQECENLTTCRLCAETWVLQSTLGWVQLSSTWVQLVKVVVTDQIHQLVGKVLKRCWGKIIPREIPRTQNIFGLCSLRLRWECLGASPRAGA